MNVLGQAAEIRAAFAAIHADPTGLNELAWRNLGFIATERCFCRIKSCGAREDAEDISQKLLIALARRLATNPEPIKYPPTYFNDSIHRACYRFLAEHRRDPLGGGRIEFEKCDGEAALIAQVDPDRGQIRRLRAKLPGLMAKVVRKKDKELVSESLRGTKNVALAKRFHISEATVSRRLANIAKMLRRALQEAR